MARQERENGRNGHGNGNGERRGHVNPAVALGMALTAALGGGALAVALTNDGGSAGDVRVVYADPRDPYGRGHGGNGTGKDGGVPASTVPAQPECPAESDQVAFTPLEIPQGDRILKDAEHLKSEAPFNGALLFNGDLPPEINDQNEVHVYPDGNIDEIQFYQGTVYELCPTADPVAVARRVANEEHASTGNQDVVVVHKADGSTEQICDTRQGAC